jgi:hypothetical protein
MSGGPARASALEYTITLPTGPSKFFTALPQEIGYMICKELIENEPTDPSASKSSFSSLISHCERVPDYN